MNQNNNNNYAYDFVYNSVLTQIYGTLRQLWTEHNFWARLNLIRKTQKLPDSIQITEKLLKNISDITYYIQQYYGVENARQFETLLQNHLLLSSKEANDIFAGNIEALIEDRIKSEENAVASAKFLAGLNPYWQYELLLNLFREHDRLYEQQARYWNEGNYDAEIEVFDQTLYKGLQLSDYITYGILRQFELEAPNNN